jgi:hypothetical protein
MSTLAELMFSPMPDDATAAQQRNWVTYTPLAQDSSILDKEPELKLLENRAVISGAGTTGLRTWEAALHLSSYLLSSPELIASVKGKKVIELGAGTGLLSILCASHLGAAHVTATDGDEGVVQALHENAAFNDVKDAMDIGVLWWGRALKGSWMFEKDPSFSCDLVLGADVVSDMFPETSQKRTNLRSRHTTRQSYRHWSLQCEICSKPGLMYKSSSRQPSGTVTLLQLLNLPAVSVEARSCYLLVD